MCSSWCPPQSTRSRRSSVPAIRPASPAIRARSARRRQHDVDIVVDPGVGAPSVIARGRTEQHRRLASPTDPRRRRAADPGAERRRARTSRRGREGQVDQHDVRRSSHRDRGPRRARRPRTTGSKLGRRPAMAAGGLGQRLSDGSAPPARAGPQADLLRDDIVRASVPVPSIGRVSCGGDRRARR